ncbi:MAG: ParB N-terminal domain-containing protein [Leptospiraceae bacterium]|nr:ParB N-terminal domain-containing protein [Leptospiraceae bacterium]MCP5501412.1 ParB N-terminal domain-containing protein [Leptospiraceae bacterium]
MKIRVSDVRVKHRIRKSTGDLEGLKESINRVGLLQPILIDLDNNLVSGYRRLEAVKLLGWEQIDARFIDVQNPKNRIILELEENIHRKDFSEEEKENAQKLVEKIDKEGILQKTKTWLRTLVNKKLKKSE